MAGNQWQFDWVVPVQARKVTGRWLEESEMWATISAGSIQKRSFLNAEQWVQGEQHKGTPNFCITKESLSAGRFPLRQLPFADKGRKEPHASDGRYEGHQVARAQVRAFSLPGWSHFLAPLDDHQIIQCWSAAGDEKSPETTDLHSLPRPR